MTMIPNPAFSQGDQVRTVYPLFVSGQLKREGATYTIWTGVWINGRWDYLIQYREEKQLSVASEVELKAIVK